MSADAHPMTAPCEDGEGAVRCTANALQNAGLDAREVQVPTAHGTSTPLGDPAETWAIKRAFGDPAKNRVVNFTQPTMGHLLDAVSRIEAVFRSWRFISRPRCPRSTSSSKMPTVISTGAPMWRGACGSTWRCPFSLASVAPAQASFSGVFDPAAS